MASELIQDGWLQLLARLALGSLLMAAGTRSCGTAYARVNALAIEGDRFIAAGSDHLFNRGAFLVGGTLSGRVDWVKPYRDESNGTFELVRIGAKPDGSLSWSASGPDPVSSKTHGSCTCPSTVRFWASSRSAKPPGRLRARLPFVATPCSSRTPIRSARSDILAAGDGPSRQRRMGKNVSRIALGPRERHGAAARWWCADCREQETRAQERCVDRPLRPKRRSRVATNLPLAKTRTNDAMNEVARNWEPAGALEKFRCEIRADRPAHDVRPAGTEGLSLKAQGVNFDGSGCKVSSSPRHDSYRRRPR